MAKRIIKKKKLKILPVMVILFVVFLFILSCYFFFQIKLKNIIIKNTSYLNDDYIIELANVKDYPVFYSISTSKIRKRILESVYVEKVTIKREFFHTLVIELEENKPLYIDSSNSLIVFEDKRTISIEQNDYIFRIPRLMNYIPDDKYDSFIKGMNKVDKSILGEISDIEYQPTELDKDRFLLYMDDGNMVYITLTKFDVINYYNDVLSQVENHKGILYLDSGNHFEIKE